MITIDKHKVTTIGMEKDKSRRHYLEPFAKLNNDNRDTFSTTYNENKAVLKQILDNGLHLSCTAGYMGGQCSGGHKYLKAIFCGKEWCENCGVDGSPVHLRRLGRWIPKAEQMGSLGYFVITIPENVRQFYKCRKKLTAFRTYLKRKLQRDGYRRGLIRFHWFGDCKYCKSKGCRYCKHTGMSNKWNPHLNFIVDGGYIGEQAFNIYSESFRNDLKAYFKKNDGIEVNETVFHYSYVKASETKRRMHLLKYVTRSTHRNYVKEIAELLKGYRTSSTWGSWKFKKVINTQNSNLVNVTNNVCPCCGEKITWDAGEYITDQVTGQTSYKRKLLKAKQLSGFELTHIEAGYYIINHINQ